MLSNYILKKPKVNIYFQDILTRINYFKKLLDKTFVSHTLSSSSLISLSSTPVFKHTVALYNQSTRTLSNITCARARENKKTKTNNFKKGML